MDRTDNGFVGGNHNSQEADSDYTIDDFARRHGGEGRNIAED